MLHAARSQRCSENALSVEPRGRQVCSSENLRSAQLVQVLQVLQVLGVLADDNRDSSKSVSMPRGMILGGCVGSDQLYKVLAESTVCGGGMSGYR